MYAQGVTRFLYLNIKVSIMKYRTKKKLVNFVFNNREAFIYLYAQGVGKVVSIHWTSIVEYPPWNSALVNYLEPSLLICL